MAANCEQLRQSLAHLQTQLDVLTTANNEPVPEKVKTEKQKKSKSKKSKKQAAEKVDVKETESDSSAPKDATDESKTNEANEQRARKIDETMNSLLLAINEVEVKEIKNDTEVKEVKKDEVENAVLNSNKKLEVEISTAVAKLTDVKEEVIAEENVSQVELSSNEEIAHLEEVKSISNEA